MGGGARRDCIAGGHWRVTFKANFKYGRGAFSYPAAVAFNVELDKSVGLPFGLVRGLGEQVKRAANSGRERHVEYSAQGQALVVWQ